MDYQEAVAILEAFVDSHSNLLLAKEIHMISLEETSNEEYRIFVKVDGSTDRDTFRQKTGIEEYFVFENSESAKTSFTVLVENSKEIVAQGVKAGSTARHINLFGRGTYGWGFMLDGAPVAMSNWHVLCPFGNNTPKGTNSKVQLGGQNIAYLSHFEPIGDTAQNKWDMAIATFNSLTDFITEFSPCEDGNAKLYPKVIQSTSLQIGTRAYKVGSTSPICREGTFRGVANVSVKYNDNVTRYFVGQLLFSKMSDPGDSGAVIVNAASNKIIGLNFAGNESSTIANPLFIYDGIKYGGTKFISDELEIPVYESNYESTETFNSLLSTTPIEAAPYFTQGHLRSPSTSDNFVSKKLFDGGISLPTESTLIPPSLGGVNKTYRIFELDFRGMSASGPTGHDGIQVVSILDIYGFWIKVRYNNGWGYPAGEGWINTNAPKILYVG